MCTCWRTERPSEQPTHTMNPVSQQESLLTYSARPNAAACQDTLPGRYRWWVMALSMAAFTLAFLGWLNESWLYLFDSPIWLNRYTETASAVSRPATWVYRCGDRARRQERSPASRTVWAAPVASSPVPPMHWRFMMCATCSGPICGRMPAICSSENRGPRNPE